MNDREVLGRINELMEEEHRLYEHSAAGRGLTEADQQGLSEAPFTLDEIDLDAAAELKRKGDSVDIEDPETATMIIKRDEPFHHRILWRVSISGPHDSRVLVANAEGRVIDTQ